MQQYSDLTPASAIAEAKRCLNCKVPQCRKACPVENDIPDWIHEVAMGNFGNALAIINAKSNLPAVCGRVCAHERQCQGSCVLGRKDRPVSIGRLEEFVADFDAAMNLTHENIMEKTRGRVAVIGSGPAGLTIAGELARKGVAVEIYEMGPEPGGVLMYGIPEYRLPKDVVRNEIAKIAHLGVIFHTGVTIGRDLTVDDLFAAGFDAIFIGTGTSKPKTLDVPGCDLEGVRQAIWFLRRVSLYNAGYISREEVTVMPGHHVYVVGCGNTAIDAARTCVRCGAAEVTILYHRDITRMAALRSEYNDAVAEGVKFRWNTNLTSINGTPDGGHVASIDIECEGEHITLPADRVLMAVGSVPAARIVSTTAGIDVDDKGYVVTRDNPFGMTTRKGVFAGGDVAGRPATVVHAMQNAREVAGGILRYLDAKKLFEAIDDK
ncbi:MAG: NAD(P)-dependent oxidoreductase [Muribaculaceae bacterium]|nr:NAD(P)-dependent oxidoreductase [Muribaculaceae bacterium]